MKNGLFKRLLVTLLSALLVVTSLPVTSFAAPANNAAEASSVYSELDNEKIAYEAYQALLKAVRTGKDSDFIAAYQLILKLTPTQRVHFFIHRYKDIYKSLQKKGIYSFFNPEKYLSENPDVYALAKQKNVDPVEFALEHYLSDGIFEGRSSCTDFDPIIAIVAYPDATLETIVSEDKPTDKIVEDLRKAFTQASGDDTTEGYSIGSLKPQEQELNNSKPQDTYVLVAGKKTTVQNPEVATSSTSNASQEESAPNTPSGSINENNSSSEEDNIPSGSSEIQPGPDPGPTPTPTPTPSGIRKQAVMVYLCGSSLEKRESPSASYIIMDILKSNYDPDTTEVYVLAGSAKEWGNNVIESDLGGANLGKIALYKIDPTKAGTITSDKTPEDVINTLNLVRQTDFSLDGVSISMGDASVLTKFADYVTAKTNADDYSMILFDHGGGFATGFGSDENHLDTNEIPDGLSSNEMVEAFSNMDYIKNGNKFSILGFDACLMGQYEVAYTLKDYYQNMICTPQTQWGTWDYTQIMTNVNNYGNNGYSSRDVFVASTTLAISKGAHLNAQGEYMPYTCFDSAGFSAVDSDNKTINDRIGEVGLELANLLNYDLTKEITYEQNAQAIEVYKAVKRAKAKTAVYGNAYTKESYEYVDMGELFYNIQQEISILVTKHPGNSNYSSLLTSVNALVAHLKNDSFTYFSAAYRDSGSLYKNSVVNYGSYKNAANDRLSDFAKLLGISDKMLGVSIYAPQRYLMIDADVERYNSLGLVNLGKGDKAYSDMQNIPIYQLKNVNGEDVLLDENGRIKTLQGYAYNPDHIDDTDEYIRVDGASKATFVDMADKNNAVIKTYSNGTDTIKYIYIPLKNDTDYKTTTSGGLDASSGSAALDYADTVGKLAVYISNNVDTTSSGSNTGNYKGDVICATKDLFLDNYSTGNNTFSIGLNPSDSEISTALIYTVSGTGLRADATLRDVATCLGIIQATSTNEMFGKQEGVYKYFKGMISRLLHDDADDSSKVTGVDDYMQEANLYFADDPDGSGYRYVLAGASIENGEGIKVYYGASDINTLSFYHYRVNESNNTVETIEKVPYTATANYDLGYTFFINSYDMENNEISGSYSINMASGIVVTGSDDIGYDKFAVGMMDEQTAKMFNEKDYSGYYDGTSYSVIGNDLVYDASKYLEDSGNFGYYELPVSSGSDPAGQGTSQVSMNIASETASYTEEVLENENSETVEETSEVGESENAEENLDIADSEIEETETVEETSEIDVAETVDETLETQMTDITEELPVTELITEISETDNVVVEDNASENIIQIQEYLEPEKIEVIKEDAYLGDDDDDDYCPETPDDVAA